MQRLILKLIETPKDCLLPSKVQQLANTQGVEFIPLHPGVEDDSLSTYFCADVDGNAAQYQRLADQLYRCDGVDAAYLKFEGEPPADTT